MKNFILCKSKEMEITGAPEVIQLLPLGKVKSQKGDFLVDAESFASMKQQFEARGLDLVLDYEHQTLKGVQAPAAGWIKELILTDAGIEARVEWTDAARQYLERREYRYLSPVISVRKVDTKAMALHSVALTNTPAIDGMRPIVNSTEFEGGQDTMDILEDLAAMLGMGEDATPEQLLEALKTALAEGKVMKEQAQPPAPEVVVANKDEATASPLEVEVLALKNKLADRDAEDVVQMALKAGKISPAMKAWGKEYALKDPAGFDAYLKAAPQVVPLGEMQYLDTALKDTAPDDDTLRVCKFLGVTADDIQKHGKGC